MALKTYKGIRLNYPLIFLSGLFFLATSVYSFFLILQYVYGNFDFSQMIPSSADIGLYKTKDKVAILCSGYTEGSMPEGSTWLSDNIGTWKKFLRMGKFSYDLINDNTVESGLHYKYQAIIMPGLKVLSDRELSELKKYLDQGGSIYSTGVPATLYPNGAWRGFDFLNTTFGLNYTKELEPNETYKVHTIRGGLPITCGIPAGYKLKIATWDRPVCAEVIEPRTVQASFWYDFRRQAGLVRDEISKSAGVAYGTYGKGRFVWMGFELNSVIGHQEDYTYFAQLFQNSMNYLLYKPNAFVRDWPYPYVAASVFMPVVQGHGDNVDDLMRFVGRQNQKATFAIPANLANRDPALISRLAPYGDFCVIGDIGYIKSIEDTTNKLCGKRQQDLILNYSKTSLKQNAGMVPIGFMPYWGFYNEYSLQALGKHGYGFLVSDSMIDRSVPKMIYRNSRPVLLIGKACRDDNEVVGAYRLWDREFQSFTYKEDVDRIVFEGGLYLFKTHGYYQMLPGYFSVIDDLMNYIKGKNIWMTTLSDIRKWWLNKSGIEIRCDYRSDKKLSLDISNPNGQDLENFIVQVNINKRVKNLRISSEMINTKIPRYSFASPGETLLLYFDHLEARGTRSFLVDYEGAD